MNNSYTTYEFIAPMMKNVLQPILPLEYANATSYMEQVNRLSEKVVELIDAQNKEPEVIYNLVKTMYSEGSLQGIVADLVSDIAINVKYPPSGITPAVGDGVTNDYPSIKACFDYAKTINNNTCIYFPAGAYLCTDIRDTVLDLPFAHDTYSIGVLGVPGSRLDINTLSLKTGGDVRGIDFNFVIPSSEKTPIIYIQSDNGTLSYKTNGNTLIQGDGNAVTIYLTRSNVLPDVATVDSGKSYNAVTVYTHGTTKNSSAIVPAVGNNSVNVEGYSKDEYLQDFDLTVNRNFHFTTNGEASLKFRGNVVIDSPISQSDNDAAKDNKNNTIFWSKNNNVYLSTGAIEESDNFSILQCENAEDNTRNVVIGASNGVVFGNPYTGETEYTEAPAQAFKFYKAYVYDPKTGNKVRADIPLASNNTKNLSVCYYNNVWLERNFNIPIPAGYATTDDVISMEISGWCQSGSDYPFTMTVGGQTFTLGKGEFYAKLFFTALPASGDSDNFKISGVCIDSVNGNTFVNTSLQIDLTQTTNIAFGSGDKVVFWTATAHYN